MGDEVCDSFRVSQIPGFLPLTGGFTFLRFQIPQVFIQGLNRLAAGKRLGMQDGYCL